MAMPIRQIYMTHLQPLLKFFLALLPFPRSTGMHAVMATLHWFYLVLPGLISPWLDYCSPDPWTPSCDLAHDSSSNQICYNEIIHMQHYYMICTNNWYVQLQRHLQSWQTDLKSRRHKLNKTGSGDCVVLCSIVVWFEVYLCGTQLAVCLTHAWCQCHLMWFLL